MGYLADTTGSVLGKYTFDRTYEKLGGEKNLPVAHIYNKKIGNTIDKYSNIPLQNRTYFERQTVRTMRERWRIIGENDE